MNHKISNLIMNYIGYNLLIRIYYILYKLIKEITYI